MNPSPLLSLIFSLLTFIQNKSLCFDLQYKVLHYDMVFFNMETLEDLDVSVNQVSTIDAQPQNHFLANILANFSQNPNFNMYGHLIYFWNFHNSSCLHSGLRKISKFLKPKHLWKPYFFLLNENNITSVDELETSIENISQFVTTSGLTLTINSDIYILSSLDKNSIILSNFFELYTLKNLTTIRRLDDLPKIRDADGRFNFNTLIQKSERRSDFQGAEISGLAMDIHGYELSAEFYPNDINTEARFKGGFEIEQYWFLRDALNFTEKALKGTYFIREGPGKTLTGMAAQINQDLADLCLSSTEFLEYRISGPDGISYLQPTYFADMLAFFKQPPASSIRDVFVSTFSAPLWFSLLGLWIGIVVMMQLAYKLYFSGLLPKLGTKDELMSDEVPIWAVGAVCQQGWYFTPEVTGARIIFFFGWLTGVLTFVAFSAELFSILAIQVFPIQSFGDLLREKFFVYNDGHIPTTKYFVKGLQDQGKIPNLTEKMRDVEIDSTIAKLVNSRTTMVTTSDSFFPIIEKEGYSEDFACNILSVVRIAALPVKMSMFVKRGSSLRESFNVKIILMTERGIKYRLMRQYVIETSVQCLKTSTGYHASLGSKDVFTAYLILMFGFGLGVTFGIAERLYIKFRPLEPAVVTRIGLLTSDNGMDFGKTNYDFYFTKSKKESLRKSNDGDLTV